MKTETVNLNIYQDQDCSNPHEDDGMWTLVAFSDYCRDACGDRTESIERYTDDYGNYRVWLRNKLRVGTAFFLDRWGNDWKVDENVSYIGYRHDSYRGQPDGLLLWENPVSDMGAKTVSERRKDAKNDLLVYNQWANGDCWYFSLEDSDGEPIDSCSGFYGTDLEENGMSEQLIPSLADYAEQHRLTRIEVLVDRKPQSFVHGTLYVKIDWEYGNYLSPETTKLIESCLKPAQVAA